MAEHTWMPVEGDKDSFSLRQIVYRNELGEEYVHVFDNFFYFDDPRAACWKGCSGDWPGCKMTCSAYAEIAEEMRMAQEDW